MLHGHRGCRFGRLIAASLALCMVAISGFDLLRVLLAACVPERLYTTVWRWKVPVVYKIELFDAIPATYSVNATPQKAEVAKIGLGGAAFGDVI